MRNVFDHYSLPENRVTHALMSCLAEDKPLLRRFLRESGPGVRLPRMRDLKIQEQQLPGEPEASEHDAERRGRPEDSARIYRELASLAGAHSGERELKQCQFDAAEATGLAYLKSGRVEDARTYLSIALNLCRELTNVVDQYREMTIARDQHGERAVVYGHALDTSWRIGESAFRDSLTNIAADLGTATRNEGESVHSLRLS